ncbi:hypothetical protein [Sphingomonas sp. Root710]|uniref:hypothetical protein n=1 Tax=Sphingomonas sp. Root710 TaxID=1736594 RepID=UPI000A7A3E08|nr:hypothetical protein [Sphingomonas sp. Root710]
MSSMLPASRKSMRQAPNASILVSIFQEAAMEDLPWIALIFTLLIATLAYVRLCEKA